jgi:methyl-accepting chemotaxis protein
VYLSSHGAKFEQKLREQRLLTDGVRVRFFETVESQRGSWPSHVMAVLELAASSLRDIEARRRQISALEIEPVEEMAYYTEVNERLLESLGALVINTADAGLRGTTTAYLYFLRAKEKTGLERAQVANVFGTGHFGSGQLALIAGLIATENAYLDVFQRFSPPPVLAAFERRGAGPAVAEVRRMEEILLSREGTFGVDSAVWYGTMTKKIDLLKEVEDLLAIHVTEGAARVAEQTRSSVWGAAWLAVLFMFGAVLATLALVRSIVLPLRSLARAAEALASSREPEAVEFGGPREVQELTAAFVRLVFWLRSLATAGEPAVGRVGPARLSSRR